MCIRHKLTSQISAMPCLGNRYSAFCLIHFVKRKAPTVLVQTNVLTENTVTWNDTLELTEWRAQCAVAKGQLRNI